MRFKGKLVRRKLDTDDLDLAKRKLRDFKKGLERTDATKGNTSFNKVLDDYVATLKGAHSTKDHKLAVYRKRSKPIRLTPTFGQFKQIVADIRAQKFNRKAEQSGDFVEFMGLAGLGQAEISVITRAHVDLEAGRITVHRRKRTVVLPFRFTLSCGRL